MEKELNNINHTLQEILKELRKLNKKPAESVADEIKMELIDQVKKHCGTHKEE